MPNKNQIDINFWNYRLRYKQPDEIIKWALLISDNRIVTTSFGIYSEVLLSTMTKHDPTIRVIWCDTLFNNNSTYLHATNLILKYKLNIQRYKANKSKAEIEATLNWNDITDEAFEEFAILVKIEPFQRALKEHDPEIWFTNIRVRQTEYRDSKDILSYSKNGILKVSPFYYWTDKDLDAYILKNDLTKNEDYYDPVKVFKNRECGIHFQ